MVLLLHQQSIAFYGVLALNGPYNTLTSRPKVPEISRKDTGKSILTGPAKRNLTMRCIIQAFPLSRAPGYWLLNQTAEPITLLSGSAVRLHRYPLRISHVHNFLFIRVVSIPLFIKAEGVP